MPATTDIVNAMTVDVEDYFHVTALSASLPRTSWDRLEYRAERNTHRILEMFSANDIKATFFVLGWVARRSPQLVREIQAAGHEIASHGMTHELIYRQTREVFREETRDAKALLEDLCGQRVRGYRAASYSITPKSLWALDVLVELGFQYDSSIFPVRHDIYGIRGAARTPWHHADSGMLEIPLTTVEVLGQRLPCAGGGYFRLLPYWLFRAGLRRVNTTDALPGVFYFHPWEIDPGQPRIKANWRSTFRHYTNLSSMEGRIGRLLRDFRWGRMDQVFASLTRQPEGTTATAVSIA
jgi:polysaccharide deacetylase family protein (PEP-CTERM system associated)